MNNNFVTEISEKDFKKLQLKGFDNERVSVDAKSYRIMFVEKDLNDKLEESKKYLSNLILKEQMDLPWAIVLCLHTEPTKSAIADEVEALKKVLLNPNHPDHGAIIDYNKEAYKQALYNYSYYDKWMDRTGQTTYEFGVGIDHMYSTRDKWVAKWMDYFEVRKKDTQAVYIIHLEGKPEDYYGKN